MRFKQLPKYVKKISTIHLEFSNLYSSQAGKLLLGNLYKVKSQFNHKRTTLFSNSKLSIDNKHKTSFSTTASRNTRQPENKCAVVYGSGAVGNVLLENMLDLLQKYETVMFYRITPWQQNVHPAYDDFTYGQAVYSFPLFTQQMLLRSKIVSDDKVKLNLKQLKTFFEYQDELLIKLSITEQRFIYKSINTAVDAFLPSGVRLTGSSFIEPYGVNYTSENMVFFNLAQIPRTRNLLIEQDRIVTLDGDDNKKLFFQLDSVSPELVDTTIKTKPHELYTYSRHPDELKSDMKKNGISHLLLDGFGQSLVWLSEVAKKYDVSLAAIKKSTDVKPSNPRNKNTELNGIPIFVIGDKNVWVSIDKGSNQLLLENIEEDQVVYTRDDQILSSLNYKTDHRVTRAVSTSEVITLDKGIVDKNRSISYSQQTRETRPVFVAVSHNSKDTSEKPYIELKYHASTTWFSTADSPNGSYTKRSKEIANALDITSLKDMSLGGFILEHFNTDFTEVLLKMNVPIKSCVLEKYGDSLAMNVDGENPAQHISLLRQAYLEVYGNDHRATQDANILARVATEMYLKYAKTNTNLLRSLDTVTLNTRTINRKI